MKNKLKHTSQYSLIQNLSIVMLKYHDLFMGDDFLHSWIVARIIYALALISYYFRSVLEAIDRN